MDIYDFDTGQWSAGTTCNAARYFAAGAVVGDKWYVYGGYLSSELNTLYVYDFLNPGWTQLASDPSVSRHGHTCVAYNGKLYFYGGINGTSYLSTLRIYDIATNTWSSGTSGLVRSYHSAVVSNDKMYTLFGATSASTVIGTLGVYDFSSNTWYSEATSFTAKNAASAVLYGSKIIIWGGANANWTTIYRNIDTYDTVTATSTLSYIESPMSNEVTSVTNTSPLVTITTATGQKRILGEPITFSGYAQDVEDGNAAITSNAVWTSSIDGVLGTGDTVSYQLSEGTHTITYTATDSGGLYDSKQITMQITPAKIVVTGGKIMISNGKLVTFFSS